MTWRMHLIQFCVQVVLMAYLLVSNMSVAQSQSPSNRPLASHQIAILYPDLNEPYRSVFARMVEDVEENLRMRPPNYAVGAKLNSAELQSELKRNDTRLIIALGRQSFQAASAMNLGSSIIAGGIISLAENDIRDASILALTADPDLIFARLKAFAPSVKRVITLYDPRINTWQVKLARTAARSYGIELVAREAQDIKNALYLYQEILSNLDPKQDALWLLQDSTTSDESTILPYLLHEAWDRNLIVFSSNLTHVKRGVLFALYPDNNQVGRSISNLVRNFLGGDSSHGMIPMREVLVGVNVRTANHLGINIGQQKFDAVFPQP